MQIPSNCVPRPQKSGEEKSRVGLRPGMTAPRQMGIKHRQALMPGAAVAAPLPTGRMLWAGLSFTDHESLITIHQSPHYCSFLKIP